MVQTLAVFRAALALLISKTSAALKGPEDSERIAVWSITNAQARIFFPLVIAMWVAALGYFIYDELVRPGLVTPDSVLTAVERFGPTVIPAVAIGMTVSALTTAGWRLIRPIRRGFAMNILDMLHEKLVKPLEAESEARGRAEGRTEGHAEGWTEGRAEGRAEGRTEGMAEMRDWFVRRDEAAAQGLPFDEPQPQPPPAAEETPDQ